MILKRNVGATVAPLSHISPTSPPPIPTKPMVESAPAAPPPSPPKTSPQNTSPFANVSLVKSSKLAALEASGSNAYVLVSSPTVNVLPAKDSHPFSLFDRILNVPSATTFFSRLAHSEGGER